jgi:CubicO group peptidase (beta-lactamase class C family)
VTTRDPWHIGSCTKAMTAALYARLVEKGRAKWGAKLPALFPDLAPEMDPAWANTTIDEVFRHRAGLSNIDARWLIVLRNDRRGPQPQRTSTAREWLSKPPGARPGDFLYSNTGYMIAGAAIERITKSSWEDAIAEHVFKPLKMEAAGFGPPLGDAPQGHGSGPLGGFTPKGVGPAADNPPALGPAGTVHVTFEDWAKFVRVFFDPKQTFLKPETVQRLVTPEPGQDYAYGWGVSDKPETGRVITHTGSNTMWMAQVAIQPDQGLASFVATNCGGGPADAATGGVVASLLAAIKSGTIK